jgi:predicted MFS family arabinose efflux permease
MPSAERELAESPRWRRGGTLRVTLVAGTASLALCALTTRLLPPAMTAACALAALVLAVLAWRAPPTLAGRSAVAQHLPLIGAGAAVTATGVTGTLLLSLYLREVRSFTPLGTAALFAAFGITAFAGRRLAGAIGAGRGEPSVLGTGLTFQGLALVLVASAAATRSPIPVLAACISVFGLAHVIANTGVALWTAAAPDATHGTVAAYVATAQYFGGAIGPLVIASLAGAPGIGIAIAGGVAAIAGVLTRTAAPSAR